MWGGANVIDKVKCGFKLGSDKNEYLIELLKYARDGGQLYDEVPKELYDRARIEFNQHKGNEKGFTTWQIGNIGFLASYNGRFFDGGYAKPVWEKTKNGLRYRDYYREAKDGLMS